MPGRFACAVVHDDPPQVFAADDEATLHWVLALRLVAATPASSIPEDVREELREALIEERWADAVTAWMRHNRTNVDVYPSMDFFAAKDVALGEFELQFTPLFKD